MRCWGHEMLGMWDVGDCGMFGMWDVGDVGCWGCEMLGTWDDRDGCWECGTFAGMWDVDLQNAENVLQSIMFINSLTVYIC